MGNKPEKTGIFAIWDPESDAILLRCPADEAAACLCVRLDVLHPDGTPAVHLKHQMRAESGRTVEVWKLPGPKDPFVQVHLGGADGAESAAPAPRIFFEKHILEVSVTDASGKELSRNRYERDGSKKEEG